MKEGGARGQLKVLGSRRVPGVTYDGEVSIRWLLPADFPADVLRDDRVVGYKEIGKRGAASVKGGKRVSSIRQVQLENVPKKRRQWEGRETYDPTRTLCWKIVATLTDSSSAVL
jgi:hypothetical protein